MRHQMVTIHDSRDRVREAGRSSEVSHVWLERVTVVGLFADVAVAYSMAIYELNRFRRPVISVEGHKYAGEVPAE